MVVTIEAEDNHNFKDSLSQIKVPTLVIGGVYDYFYPIKETADGIPNAKLILYENYVHNAWMDNRKTFHKDVMDFLNAE